MNLRSLCTAILFAACAAPAARPTGPLALVDDAGDTLHLSGPARRIVSLSPATTEVLFFIGAGGQVVGRTRWCDYPGAAAAVESVGDGMPPNVESVLARHPDLVLLYRSPQNGEALRQFRAAGIGTLQLTLDHLDDVGRITRLLGRATGQAAAADSLAGSFENALQVARSRSDSVPTGPRPRVLLLAWDQPPIAIGGRSFQSEILELAGGANLFGDLAVPSGTVSIEAIAARRPDLVLVSDTGTPSIVGRPEWRAVTAVARRRFVHLGTPAFSRPSPRALGVVDTLRQLLAAAPR